MQIRPLPSIGCAPGAFTDAPTAMMAPSRTCTAPFSTSPMAASIERTCAPRMTNSPRAGSAPDGAPCAAARFGSSVAAVKAVVPASTARRSISLLDMCRSPGSAHSADFAAATVTVACSRPPTTPTFHRLDLRQRAGTAGVLSLRPRTRRNAMKAKDVMTRHVVSIAPDATVLQAARLMLQHHISGLPVVDSAGALVGILSEGDFLRRRETATERRRSRWLEFLIGPGKIASEYTHSHGKKVAEVMTDEVRTVAEDTPHLVGHD